MAPEAKDREGFEVARWVDLLGGHMAKRPRFWTRLGNLETRMVEDEIEDVRIEQPIYVCGLARSGSTKLLETLAAHPATASHRYSDYPPVFTPYVWNRVLARMPKQATRPAERTHKDGIEVTAESPEAFEEVLWMAFFDHLHDPSVINVLDRATTRPAFERFYRDHIRKLLRVRGGQRYLAKGNYNLTRLPYLLKLFPDARFVVPVRDPVWHIASLMKQHRLFRDGEAANPKALEHMRRVGHFEFGLDRRPVHVGDPRIERVKAAWADGREVAGWAHYWAMLHDHVADRLAEDPALAAATLIVRFENLCEQPAPTVRALLGHCRLDAGDEWIREVASGVRFPSYYRPTFSDDELGLIREITATSAGRLGYGAKPALTSA